MQGRSRVSKPSMWLPVLALAVSLGCWAATADSSASPRAKLEIVTKYKMDDVTGSSAPSSRLRMGLWNDDKNTNNISKATVLEQEENKKKKKKKKKSEVGPIAVNPMVLPPRQHRQPLAATSSSRDSYLDALEYSRRVGGAKSTIGPVYYRPESTGANSSATAPAADHRQSSKIEATLQSNSRISHGAGGVSDKLSYLTTLDSLPYAHGGHHDHDHQHHLYQQAPYHGLADDYDPYSYGPAPSIVVSAPSSSGGYYGTPVQTESQHQQGLGSLQATYSTSYPLPDLFPLAHWPPLDLNWPISVKLNTYTLIKIILKLIIFKMIVKFIGAVCLLLFIPKLIHKKHDDDDDESRGLLQLADGLSFERLHSLASQVAEALESHGRRPRDCSASAECQVGRTRSPSGWADAWNDNVRLFGSYLVEERALMGGENY